MLDQGSYKTRLGRIRVPFCSGWVKSGFLLDPVGLNQGSY